MKQLLKYLIPFTLIAVFLNTAGNLVNADQSNQIIGYQIETAEITSDTSRQDYSNAVQRRISFSNSLRIKNCARRTTGLQRNTIDSFRLSKTIGYLIPRQSIQKQFAFSSKTEHTHRLAGLGKLLI